MQSTAVFMCNIMWRSSNSLVFDIVRKSEDREGLMSLPIPHTREIDQNTILMVLLVSNFRKLEK